MQSKIETLKKKKEQIEARIKNMEAKEKSKAKKLDTRRKILIGVMVMEQMEKDEIVKKKILMNLDGFLTRPMDRMLFDLDASQSSRERGPEKQQAQKPPPLKSQGEKADAIAKKSPQSKAA